MEKRKVALVTGANKGIGHEIAKQLAERGYVVLLGSRDLARGEAAARTLRGEVRPLQLDVTNRTSIAAAAARVREELGRLDVLVNNAGIARGREDRDNSIENIRRRGAPSSASLDEIREVFETNLFGAIAVTQAFLPLLRDAPAGRIVNISSGLPFASWGQHRTVPTLTPRARRARGEALRRATRLGTDNRRRDAGPQRRRLP